MDTNYQFFMKENMDKFIGEWVAICDKKVIAHGENVKEVFSQTKKKCPNKIPLITKISDKKTRIF